MFKAMACGACVRAHRRQWLLSEGAQGGVAELPSSSSMPCCQGSRGVAADISSSGLCRTSLWNSTWLGGSCTKGSFIIAAQVSGPPCTPQCVATGSQANTIRHGSDEASRIQQHWGVGVCPVTTLGGFSRQWGGSVAAGSAGSGVEKPAVTPLSKVLPSSLASFLVLGLVVLVPVLPVLSPGRGTCC